MAYRDDRSALESRRDDLRRELDELKSRAEALRDTIHAQESVDVAKRQSESVVQAAARPGSTVTARAARSAGASEGRRKAKGRAFMRSPGRKCSGHPTLPDGHGEPRRVSAYQNLHRRIC
jgi:hypothetical protein